jgi:hypothetical protein
VRTAPIIPVMSRFSQLGPRAALRTGFLCALTVISIAGGTCACERSHQPSQRPTKCTIAHDSHGPEAGRVHLHDGTASALVPNAGYCMCTDETSFAVAVCSVDHGVLTIRGHGSDASDYLCCEP